MAAGGLDREKGKRGGVNRIIYSGLEPLYTVHHWDKRKCPY